ncbi:MAG: hypothetical protein KGQ93_14675 [Cyanobacteria bacterium REEB459]|nr:hypothetical protein [Cyanobacteria bacterium REEB459]
MGFNLSGLALPLLVGSLALTLPLFSLPGCFAMTPLSLPGLTRPDQSVLPAYPQGIEGRVLELKGNQMPRLGTGPSGGAPQPVRTRVWVFAAPLMAPGTPNWPVAEAAAHPQRLGWVESDDRGQFRVGLPTGEYVLLAQYGDRLYLNSFQGDGHYTPVRVEADKVTPVDLVNSEGAFF